MTMSEQEKLTRALAAAKPHYPGWSIAEIEKSSAYIAVLEALTDLDKPIPDPDEAWRPFVAAIEDRCKVLPLDQHERRLIARIKAARHLIPEQYR